jgi:hypothetical protein
MDKKLILLFIGLAIGLFGGIIIGMIIQQMVIKAFMVEFGESLRDLYIPVFNETFTEERR